MTFPGRLGRFRWALLLAASLALVSGVLAADRDEDRTWVYRAPVRPPIPATRDQVRVRNPVDAFLLERLERASLTFAPEADRRTLIRRLTFDLTGVPPTPNEIDTFVADPRPDAYEQLVGRLLASPRYGERWASFWLDLVRYAETDGFKADDTRPGAWRYRDYVIAALNADKPYDRFLREQVAGDELYPKENETLIATGFLRHYPDEYNAVNLEQRRQEILNDITDTTSQVVLGLTLGCARCHDHKFDPITQEDYYRFQAFFAAYQPSEVPMGPQAEVEKYRQDLRTWEAKTAEVRRRMDELEEPVRKSMMAKRKSRFPKEYQEMFEKTSAQRSPFEEQIAFMVAKQVNVASDEVGKTMKGESKQRWDELKKQMGAMPRPTPPRTGTAMTMNDVGPTAPVTHFLKRGDWRHPGKEVQPGFLSAMAKTEPKVTATGNTTGRRTEIARWLTQQENPLTARVLVNRLWQQHFGRGLVGTPSDFGLQGEAVTHPELLDWLATEFMARNWSMKEMHRLMVLSTAYRQSSGWEATGSQLDPENRLLWRMNRRRLDGEVLRDSLLTVAGVLNAQAGGPSVGPELPAELTLGKSNWPTSATENERNRRSVYVFAKRNLRYPFFSTFDAPDANETCARRFTTTTAPQALMLLNSKMTLDLARTFAERVVTEVGNDPEARVNQAFRLALGRLPDAEERATMQSFLERGRSGNPSAMSDLCHALLNLNEFLYVD